jgi:two-component system cell cycle sensor histidine kinase/response regulator CckA
MTDSTSELPKGGRARPTTIHRIAGNLALAVSYYLTAQLGLLIPSVGPMVCLLWPPAGLALAVIYRAGPTYAVGLFLGAFATNFGLCGPEPAAAIAVGITLATLAASYILSRYDFNREFHSLTDTKIFLGAAVFQATITAMAGTLTLVAFDDLRGARADRALLNWWLGDMGGAVIVAPFLLAVSRADLRRLRRVGLFRDTLFSTLIIVGLGLVLHSGLVPNGLWTLPTTFVLMLLVARTASISGVWPASLQLIWVAGWVVWNNHVRNGPNVFLVPEIRIYAAWAFLTTASVVSLGIASLLAERAAVERRLLAGEQTYRALVHDNPALIGRFGTDGDLNFANETFRHAFQLSAGDESSVNARRTGHRRKSFCNFYELTGLDHDEKTLTLLREHDEPEQPIGFETQSQTGAAAGRWFRWTARAVDLSSSAVSEYHVVGLDITDQKRAEAERKTLETQAIQTQQYEAIGVLAGGIAHEFNNILTGLIGNTDLAMMLLPKSAEVRPMLAEVLRGAQRAAELTKQLSIYAGQTDTHPRSQSVGDLVRSCERLVDVVLPKHATIRYELTNTATLAVVDETKFRQLLLSVVTNAAESFVDKSRPGTITVRLLARTVTPEIEAKHWFNGVALVAGEYIELEVVDNGCGMTAATLSRIFEPFFTTKFPGRGLGMAAVLGIIQDHAGAIDVRSEPGGGTTVRILLPTPATSVDFPTPLPRTIRRSGRISNRNLVRK